MQAMIFYEDWQMDCCGDPFAIGDDVNWVCVKGDDGALVACDYYYDAHADEYAKQFYITGQVMDITQINFCYELKAGICVPSTYHQNPLKKAQAFMFKNGGGFLVLLDNVVIKS